MSGTQQLLLGEVSGGPATYIEDVFSTYLYTGNGSTQTITNNIDLSTKGGMVWTKGRTSNPKGTTYDANIVCDTNRGSYSALSTNSTAGTGSYTGVYGYTTSGFNLGSEYVDNNSSVNYTSWTFRKQPKFFDVVTYTGNGSNRTIAHNLGSVPGCIMVKRTDTTGAWQVYHRSLANTEYMVLNTAANKATGTTRWNSTTPTSTEFSLGTDATVNANGGTYVAYLFAHDAGGFGLTGSDNVISCGSYSGNSSSPPFVNLGWEPQFVMVKLASYAFASGGWHIFDNMRGMGVSSPWQNLSPNSSAAESPYGAGIIPTATGFQLYGNDFEVNTSDGGPATYIYIAIRRGPMKVPTDGTKVFLPSTRAGTGSTTTVTTNFPSDSYLCGLLGSNSGKWPFASRLTGTYYLRTPVTDAEVDGSGSYYNSALWQSNTSIKIGDGGNTPTNASGSNYVDYNFRRAPNFFDVVCYTGNGAGTYNINHNLGVTPEMLIIKDRSVGDRWSVYFPAFDTFMTLNATNGKQNGSPLPSAVTSTTFNVGNTTGYASVSGRENTSGATYVSYLFATCAGVSKVGSYTGNGTTQTINCGFAGGARFVLIKRTDAAGDWYIYDTARGMTTLVDPYLLLNSTAAESATLGSVTTVTTGFAVNASILAAINTNAASYIFLAIA